MRSAKEYLKKWHEDENGSLTGITSITSVSRELPDAMDFPTATLPRPCRRLVEEAAAAIGCPPDFVGLPLLVAMGCAIGNARRVRLKQGWTEGAALYASVVADPGEKKTPAYKVAIEAVIKAQGQMRAEHREKKDEYARELREYEVDKAQARKDGEPAPPPPEEPAMGRALIEDTTIEALAGVLEHNPRGVLVVRDELAAWKRSMDQYRAGGKGADRQFWLSAWSNSYASVDRKGRSEPMVLTMPFVGVFGSIQPAVLPDIGAGREDGLLDRFLFAYPAPTPTRWTDDEISDGAIGNVKWLYDKLRGLRTGEDEYGDPQPDTVPFAPEAKSVFVELLDAHREEMEQPGFPVRLKGPWAKLEAYLARLALIVGLCRVLGDGDTPERIETQDVLRASILVEYFKVQARRVYVGLHGENTEDRLAEDVAKFLIKHGGSWEGQPADLHEQLESAVKPERAEELSKLLKAIAEHTPALSCELGNKWIKELQNKRRVVRLTLNNAGNAGNAGNAEEVS